MKTIVRHFLCKEDEATLSTSKNMWVEDKENHIYCSGYWKVHKNDADALVGGKIFLHRTKEDKSYFGGEILSYSFKDDDPENRIIFKFKAEVEARGRRWEGKYEPVSYCMDSGNVEVEL